MTSRGMFLKNRSPDSKADLTKIRPLSAHSWCFFLVCLGHDECRHPSPRLHTLGIPRSTYQVCSGTIRYALSDFNSYTRDLFFPLKNLVFIEFVLPPYRVYYLRSDYLKNQPRLEGWFLYINIYIYIYIYIRIHIYIHIYT